MQAKGSYSRGVADGVWTLFGEAGVPDQKIEIRGGKLVEVDGAPPTETT